VVSRTVNTQEKAHYFGADLCWALQSKSKSKTVGVARQQRRFLCGDKENEAKKAWRCAGHVLLGAFWWQVSAV
jgi:hypothetical protein